MDTWLVIFVLGTLTIFSGLTLGLLFYFGQRRQQENHERLRIADKFETSAELASFLESQAGHRFLESFGRRAKDPRRTILASLPIGIVFLLIGIGTFLGISDGNLEDGLGFPAVIFCGAGLGILISAVVSSRLIRAWRMTDDDQP